MLLSKRVRGSSAALILLIFSLSFPALAGPEKSKKKKETPKGTPVLWREPDDIGSRNLLLGPGGAAMRPNLRRIRFIKEEKGGYSKKFRISDGSGREWVAKVSKEAQSETAAVRLLWAVGYMTEVNYLVPRLRIPGKGIFENVRLEARPKSIERLDEWKWEKNPFVGTKQFQGLKVMMLLFNNWDIKDSNNQMLLIRGGRGESNQLHYIISDLGATFGKTGSLPIIWRITRSRNNPEDYANSKFIDDVKNGMVYFHYGGKKQDVFEDITINQARWIGGWLSRLSDQQLRDAFRAANYEPDEIRLLVEAVRSRVDELVQLPAQTGDGR
ncbi:MAG TPA: hypothetical protein VGB17_01325 [Pyrinomonadaceae bacterium]|jgi:hypothetical protein